MNALNMTKLDCILLVDDDEVSAVVNQLVLNKMGITKELLLAKNGEQALEILDDRYRKQLHKPDLIFLDINMPVMNGFEFMEAYLPQRTGDNAPIVVMLTTSVNHKDVKKSEEYKVDFLLNKPLTELKVSQILEKLRI